MALLLARLPQLPQAVLTTRGRTAAHAVDTGKSTVHPVIAAAASSIARS
ncbi:hypothetical protein [Pseudonocardia sp.]|nr:hypothetical protein [Pseudonocardia sp.]